MNERIRQCSQQQRTLEEKYKCLGSAESIRKNLPTWKERQVMQKHEASMRKVKNWIKLLSALVAFGLVWIALPQVIEKLF